MQRCTSRRCVQLHWPTVAAEIVDLIFVLIFYDCEDTSEYDAFTVTLHVTGSLD